MTFTEHFLRTILSETILVAPTRPVSSGDSALAPSYLLHHDFELVQNFKKLCFTVS